MYYRRARWTDAEQHLERAKKIAITAFGLQSPRLARMTFNLAEILQAEGRMDKARSLYEEALRVQEQQLGAESPEVAKTLDGYSRLLSATKDNRLAREMEARALQIREDLAFTVSAGELPSR